MCSWKTNNGQVWHCNTQHKKKVLDYIYKNIWGPSKNESIEGNRWFVTFINDFSKKSMSIHDETQGWGFWCFFLMKKNIVETQTRKRIKTLQLDNDGKYTSDPLFKVCQNEGIKWHFTVRNTPQQNGVEECMNHTLVKKFWFMLSYSRLSKAF